MHLYHKLLHRWRFQKLIDWSRGGTNFELIIIKHEKNALCVVWCYCVSTPLFPQLDWTNVANAYLFFPFLQDIFVLGTDRRHRKLAQTRRPRCWPYRKFEDFCTSRNLIFCFSFSLFVQIAISKSYGLHFFLFSFFLLTWLLISFRVRTFVSSIYVIIDMWNIYMFWQEWRLFMTWNDAKNIGEN